MFYKNFVGASYPSQSPIADQEELINFYVEQMESPGASSRFALYPTPGVTALNTALSSPGKGHIFIDGREFAVIGTSLVEINISGTITVRGTVSVDANPATISSNGDGGGQLFVTSGANGYYYNLATNVLTQVAALNGKATMGDFLDGYFLALDANTSTFYISNLLNGAVWTTGTDFAQRSGAADPWIAMKVNPPYIWLFGEQTSEVWYDSGAANFPFALHPSGRVPYGIAAPFSATSSNGYILWLGATKIGDSQVLRSSGFTPEEVSDYPRRVIFHGYSVISDAQGDIINYLGHIFYLLTFTEENITWAFDVQTNIWSRWQTWVSESNKYVAWRPRWHAMAFGEHRMLDSETGTVYRLGQDIGTDVDSRPIRRVRRAPALSYENRLIRYPGFELDLEPGLGKVTGQGSDPQVMMRQSSDGGKTWSNERMKSAGSLGQYGKRVRWNRCGAGRRMVFETVFSDPIPWRIIGAYLTPDPIGVSRAA